MRTWPAAWLAAALLAATGLSSGCGPWRAAHLYGSGTEALEAGRVDRAVADLEQAAALAPHASEVQNHLGLAYQAAGREGEAQDAFERAVELDCENQAAAQNLAAARALLGPGSDLPAGQGP